MNLYVEGHCHQDEKWKDEDPVIPQLPYRTADEGPGTWNQRLIKWFIMGLSDVDLKTRLRARDYITSHGQFTQFFYAVNNAVELFANKEAASYDGKHMRNATSLGISEFDYIPHYNNTPLAPEET